MQQRNLAGRAGRWSARHRRKAILGWLAFVVISVLLGGALGMKEIASEDLGDGESKRADQILADAFPDQASEEVLLQGQGGIQADDPRFREGVRDVVRAVSGFDTVRNVQSPLEPGNASHISPDGRSALVTFDLLGDDDELEDNVTPVQEAVAGVQSDNPGLLIEEFGDASADKALSQAFEDDLRKAETLSLPITLVILVVAFGSLAAAGVPLVLAISAVAAALGLVGVFSQVVPVDQSISSVILLIGLAVGVDYSLFYLRREREERAAGHSEQDSLQAAASTSGRAVLVSGLTVIIAMAGMYITGNATFISFATGTIIVVAIAVLGSLTVLPAVLSKLGDRVEWGRVPFRRRMSRADRGEGGVWSAIVDRVLRRPIISLVLATATLVVLAIPAFSLHTVNTGVNGIPKDLPIMQTYDRIQAAFPGEPLSAIVAVEAPDVESEPMRTAIARLGIRAEFTGDFHQPVSTTVSPDGTVAQVSIPIAGNGTDDRSVAALHTLRDDVIPFAFGPVPDASAYVTGMTAQSVDFNDLLKSRAPLVFVFVLGLAFVLLLIVFRSIVIPLKAIALNLLSVGAAYGVLVYVFQYGHFESLLGFESIGGITAWLPLFLFVLLFGLSMDYHVFILSRVREGVDRGMDTDEAVAHGIKSTAGTVTSAATVMVFVFAIFATLSALDFKMMGVGLAVAVLIDATIIRAVLLPASMKLLGDWNWYFPARLEWLPDVSLEGTSTKPATGAPRATSGRGLEVGVERRGPRVRVELTGELDLASAKLLHERLEQVESENPELLVLDLRRLGFLDSSGLREVIGAVQRGREEGRKVALVRAHGPIEDLLQLTRVEEMSATVEDPAAVGFPDEGDRP
jgi:RND superfamily putative drug exporter